jgi:hypothetical protein
MLRELVASGVWAPVQVLAMTMTNDAPGMLECMHELATVGTHMVSR